MPWQDVVVGGAPFSPVLEVGDLLLWDSRTVHCSTPCAGSRENALARAAALICYTPRSKASEETLRRRRAAALSGATTTHYPHECVLTSNHGDYAASPDAVRARYRVPPPPELAAGDWRYV